MGACWLVARNGNYYFYFTAAKKIGVARKHQPTGPFVDKGSALAAGAQHMTPIDPMVFIDTDGQAYAITGVNHHRSTSSGLTAI